MDQERSEQDLLIEGDPELLDWISERIESELGASAALERATSINEDEFREPFTIALIVALGGPAIIQGIVAIIDRALEHREKMRALDIVGQQVEQQGQQPDLRLALVAGDDTETATDLDSLRAMGIT